MIGAAGQFVPRLTSTHVKNGNSPTFEFVRLSKRIKATSTQSRMAPSNRNVSHAEIWDDSALVNSWNDALEEYKVSCNPQIHCEQC
jgi:hypothetical protein